MLINESADETNFNETLLSGEENGIQQNVKHSNSNVSLIELISCFSILENASEISKDSSTKDPNLNVFNGIRILSIMWIVFGH